MKRIKRLASVLFMMTALLILPSFQSLAAAVPDNVKKLTANPAENSITLTWNNVTGAKGYKIYQVDASGEERRKIATTSKNSYTVNKLKLNREYSYQVFAFNKAGISEEGSPIVTAKTAVLAPAAPENLVISLFGDKTMTLKWSRVANAHGYYVYVYNEKTDSYKLKKTTKDTTVTLSNLTDGKEYKIQVLAFRKVQGVTAKSKPSTVTGTAREFSSLTKSVHGRYYNTYANADTKATVVSTGKKINIKKGTKIVAHSMGGSETVATLKDGTKIKIAVKRLKFTSLNTTTKEYSKAAKEAFVNDKGYSSSTPYLIWISQYTLNTSVFKGSRGKWKLVRSMPCVVGAMGKTPPGIFRICKRSYAYGGPMIYFTWNSYKDWGNAFHRRVDGNTRAAVSHGCVRLADADLSFIASNCGMGTTVVSY